MYLIYRDPGLGTLELLDSTTNLSYIDTIVFCSTEVSYQIHQYDSSGCYSISNIDSDIFADVTPPDIPQMDFVTVDIATQDSYLEWQPSNAPDVVGYIVYIFDGAIWTPIDTVSTTFYEDIIGTPDLNVEAYRVAAIDSCDNTSPMDLEHNTMFLTTEKDICDDLITLNWTPYINLDNSLDAYEIHVSIDGDPYQFLASVTPSETTYEHVGLSDSTEFCYYVMAVNDDGTKTPISNVRCEYSTKPFQPQFAYIRYVTVVDNNFVEIAMYSDTTAKVSGFKLQRDVNHNGTFQQIANLPPSVNPLIFHEDFQVDVDKNVYTYRFIVQDSCGVDAITSNEATTILLTGEQGNDLFTNVIEWTEYEGWPTGPFSYDIYRGTDNPYIADFVAQVPVGTNSYLDIFPDNVLFSEGKVSYYVIGNEAGGNPYGFTESSTSNIVFIPQPPRVYVPNAFSPGGRNPIFQPIMLFVDQQNYFFAVYDRWGQEIFKTFDINQGWDGTYNGSYVRNDVYTWILKARFANGIIFERKGVVNVLR